MQLLGETVEPRCVVPIDRFPDPVGQDMQDVDCEFAALGEIVILSRGLMADRSHKPRGRTQSRWDRSRAAEIVGRSKLSLRKSRSVDRFGFVRSHAPTPRFISPRAPHTSLWGRCLRKASSSCDLGDFIAVSAMTESKAGRPSGSRPICLRPDHIENVTDPRFFVPSQSADIATVPYQSHGAENEPNESGHSKDGERLGPQPFVPLGLKEASKETSQESTAHH